MNQLCELHFSHLNKYLCEGADDELRSNKSSVAVDNLEKALNKTIVLKDFGEFEDQIDLSTFDWKHNKRDRNWWWQLQALPFLNWFVDSYDALDEQMQNEALEFCYQSTDALGKCCAR